jgi:hypothetical protein
VSKCWKQEKSSWKRRWLCSAKDSSVWLHRTVRWCTGQCPVRQAGVCQLAALGKKLTAYGYKSSDCPVVHRTVRWCTGLSGEPTVGRANGRSRNPRVTRGKSQRSEGAPDCPVCTGHANGSKAPTVSFAKEGKKSAPDSVRWSTGLSGAPGDRRQELPS